ALSTRTEEPLAVGPLISRSLSGAAPLRSGIVDRASGRRRCVVLRRRKEPPNGKGLDFEPHESRSGAKWKMGRGLRAYAAVLRLVRRLPAEARPYYAKYARENFVNYREVDGGDANQLDELFRRAYNHTVWVLNKYSVDQSAADELKGICCK
ncbi:hypothetical protein Taro_040280, partial [Colocasia esculenta]|nr:hypothetical protein [Colocasia esculenta]